MRQIIMLFLVVMVSLGLCINQAEAKRFGGGKSFGYQRSSSNSFTRHPSEPSRQAAQPGAGMSRWMGPLMGLAAGGLLSYLLMGHGLGSGILTWLAIGIVGLFIWNFIRRKFQPVTQSHFGATRSQTPLMNEAQFNPVNSVSSSSTIYPTDFHPDEFIREAKIQFIRLQAAYDAKNLQDLREFTAPEVVGEIQLQFQERGDAPNHTEVVKLDAELLDVSLESQATIASVRFTGLIREEMNASAVNLNEIWHFKKYSSKDNQWLVAGIQQ